MIIRHKVPTRDEPQKYSMNDFSYKNMVPEKIAFEPTILYTLVLRTGVLDFKSSKSAVVFL